MNQILKKFKKKHYNFLPGPVDITSFSKKSYKFPIISQRNKDFEYIYFDLIQSLKLIVDNPFGEIIAVTGSGTLAMEMAIDNFVDISSKVLVISNGKFGDRFCEILKCKEFNYNCLNFANSRKVSYEEIENEILKEINNGIPYTHLLFQATETSTGIALNLDEIKKIKEKYKLFLICDSISHILSNYFSQEYFNIDLVIFSSQKGLSSLAGISFISILKSAITKIVNSKNYYMNIKNYLNNLIPYTPAILNIYNLWLNIKFILKKVVVNIIEKNISINNKIRDFLKNYGLEEYPLSPSNSLVVFYFNNSSSFVLNLYKKYNISIADGQGFLKNNAIRIATMGLNDLKNYNYLLKILKKEFKFLSFN